MKRVIVAVTLVLAISPVARAQNAQVIDPSSLVWTTCGSCPAAPEVVGAGGTVTVGVAGRQEAGYQVSAKHMAATALPPAASYSVTFSYALSTWDSYVAPGTPNPPYNGGTGYWDSFSVSTSAQPYWLLSLTDPLTPAKLPGLGFFWGGSSYGDGNIKTHSGTTTVTLAGNGANPVYLNVGLDSATSPDADTNYPSWGTFTILEVKAVCSGDIADVTGVPAYYQCGNPYHAPPAGTAGAWWAEPYGNGAHVLNPTDGLSYPTTCKLGCAMTAYAMLLSHYGFAYDPSTLNTTLKNLGTNGFGGSDGKSVVFQSVSTLTGNTLEYRRSTSAADLDADLCDGKPAILEVTNSNGNGHFVLAIGKVGGSYRIIDPGHINVTSLSYYNDAFVSIRRFIAPASGAFVAQSSSAVHLLVTDPVGRKVGYNAGTVLTEVLGSSYDTETLDDDDPLSPGDYSVPQNRVLSIPSPTQGYYSLQITGVSATPATVTVQRYNKQNLPQSVLTFNVNLAPGATSTVEIPYSILVGDANGDGYVDQVDLGLVKTALGSHPGDAAYLPAADLNGDGVVDAADVQLVIQTGDVDFVANGAFANGLTGWQTFATPGPAYIVAGVAGGVLQFSRVPPPPGPNNQATVYQETGVPLVAGAPIVAQFSLANTSAVRKYMKVLVVDRDFSDFAACTFWLPANSPMLVYQVLTHTTRPWASASIYFYAGTANAAGDTGAYQVDDVSVEYAPGQAVDQTECVDPFSPAAPGGAPGANLLTNGDFGTNALPPWTTFGTVTAQAPGGVLQMIRPTATFPAGVVLQPTGLVMPSGQILTATFQLGNSSGVRKRVTAIIHDRDFSDLVACVFWLSPGQALSNYSVVGWASKPWTDATVSLYPATIGPDQWTLVDNVTFRTTPATATTGSLCGEPAVAPAPGLPAGSTPARRPGSRTTEARPPFFIPGLRPY